jgi:alkanesulfonate monooxygenase SsuD/methylene tetrahydromethanopterin reductase-like flavin-dependent oxidoreductase (luciferase family)
MKFGFFSLMQNLQGEDEHEVVRQEMDALVMGEELGFHSGYLAEHHFSPYCLGGSIATLAANLAGRTSRIKVGTAVVVLPYHNPVRVAEDWATVDVLSGGRVELGLGRGYNPFEFASLGIPLAENADRFSEGLDLMRRAWTGDWLSFQGRFYTVNDTRVLPRPMQKPEPRLWYACVSPSSSEKAARLGLGMCTLTTVPPAQLNDYRASWIAAARAAGRDDAWIIDTIDNTPEQRIVWVTDDDKRAYEEAKANISRYGDSLEQYAYPGTAYPRVAPKPFQYERQGPTTERAWDIDRMLPYKGAIVGSPSKVLDQIEELRAEHDMRYMIMWTSIGSPDRTAMKRSLRLFAEKVMPRLRPAPPLRLPAAA